MKHNDTKQKANKIEDDQLIKCVADHLTEQSEGLAEDINKSLANARMAALDTGQVMGVSTHLKNLLFSFLKPAPMSALITVCLLVVVLLNIRSNDTQPHNLTAGIHEIADIEILLSEDNLEFYEDLEFYEWLLQQESHSS